MVGADWAYNAAKAIAKDIRGRKGIGNELEEIEEDIVKEMLEVWAQKIEDEYYIGY